MLRPSLRLVGLCAGLLISANALALSLGSLSQGEASVDSRTPWPRVP